MQREQQQPGHRSRHVPLLVAMFCLASGLMLLINKVVLLWYPYPHVVLLIQVNGVVGWLLTQQHHCTAA